MNYVVRSNTIKKDFILIIIKMKNLVIKNKIDECIFIHNDHFYITILIINCENIKIEFDKFVECSRIIFINSNVKIVFDDQIYVEILILQNSNITLDRNFYRFTNFDVNYKLKNSKLIGIVPIKSANKLCFYNVNKYL